MRLILATTNRHKICEIKQILRGLPVKVLSILDLRGAPRVKENGATFEENAAKKARAFAKKFGALSLADDSGLEVKALGGAPGIRSARFAGANSTTEALCKKVLTLLNGRPARERSARFICCIALAFPDGKVSYAKGYVHGRIIGRMIGGGGFGYDPIFVPRGYKSTFAQMTPAAKNRLSHRGRALKRAKIMLKKLARP